MLNVKEPNDYGGRTFEIEISPSYTINIIEVDDKEKIIRLLDRGIIFTETEFEVTADKDLIEAVKLSFYKSRSHINGKKGNEWERGRFREQLNEALSLIDDYTIKSEDEPNFENKSDREKDRLKEYYSEIADLVGEKEAIHFFQVNDIDIKKFYSNYNELKRTMEGAYIKAKLDLEPTKSIEEFGKGPPAYPQWYIAAFPDVALWAMDQIEEKEKHIMSKFKKQYKEFREGERKKLSINFLRYITARYKKNNELECSK